MAGDFATSVLKRKTQAAAPMPRPPMFPARALALAVPRAAQEELGLAIGVRDLAESMPDLDAIEAAAGNHALLALLAGRGDATGLAVLSAELIGAVVAQRMTGRVPSTPAPGRPPTRIDAEMARDLIDRVLGEFEDPLVDRAETGWVPGYRFHSCVNDSRLLRFSLADMAYHGFQMDLDIADGTTGGTLFLALPAISAAKQVDAVPLADEAWSNALRGNVMGVEMTIEAVLARLRLPLSKVAGMQAGDVLPLPRQALAEVRLEAAGRAMVASGRLGQCRGDRAVKIAGDAPTDPEPAAAQPGAVPSDLTEEQAPDPELSDPVR